MAGGAGAPEGLPQDVLERVRQREPEALGAFFEAYFDRVYGLVYRLLGHRALAEDAVQDVFLKAYRAADRIETARDPWPWLCTIATNACRDLWRSGAHRMARQAVDVDAPEVRSALPARGDDPERALLRAERERLVQQAIDRLPDEQRMSVLLFDYAGLPHEAIAELAGISHEAARKRHSRALAALGRMLKEVLGPQAGEAGGHVEKEEG